MEFRCCLELTIVLNKNNIFVVYLHNSELIVMPQYKHFLSFVLLAMLLAASVFLFVFKAIPDPFHVLSFVTWLLVLLFFNFLSWPYLLRRIELLPFFCNAFILLLLTHLFFCFILNTLRFLLNKDLFLHDTLVVFFLNLLPFLPFVLSQKSNQNQEQ